MKTRFAPSPTGFLHAGHAYSALFAARLAHKEGGEFLIRFEDIDHTRVRPEYYEAIEEDLEWLGLDWPRPALRQLDRFPAYEAALEQLREIDLLYPCFCTRKEIRAELAELTRAPHEDNPGLTVASSLNTPPCPRNCRTLSMSEKSTLAETREPTWRFHTAEAAKRLPPLSFREKNEVVSVESSSLGDPILGRRDIGTSYHLAVVVDDAFQEITHVTRGLDLLPATHLHRLLQETLGLPEPAYHHHALVTGSDGNRLAKRDDAPPIRELRENGVTIEEFFESLSPLS